MERPTNYGINKFEIFKLMHEIHLRLLTIGKGAYFRPFEKMIKTCFLPQNMFYHSTKENINRNINYINNNKITLSSSSSITTKESINSNYSSNKIDIKKNDIVFGHKKMNSEIPNKNDKEKKGTQVLSKTSQKIVSQIKRLVHPIN